MIFVGRAFTARLELIFVGRAFTARQGTAPRKGAPYIKIEEGGPIASGSSGLDEPGPPESGEQVLLQNLQQTLDAGRVVLFSSPGSVRELGLELSNTRGQTVDGGTNALTARTGGFDLAR